MQEVRTIQEAVRLLMNFEGSEYAYLLPRSYVENWIIWAKKICAKGSHKNEHLDIEKLLSKFQSRYKLKNYSTSTEFAPSPIDCSSICNEQDGANNGCLKPGLVFSVHIIAVPEQIYEFLRGIHGMLY